jgi:Phosphatidylinositol-specific phospholipase C, Y domain/C2 domain
VYHITCFVLCLTCLYLGMHHSRIYPKGARIDSSNMDPVPAWAAGNQLVALNYQTPGLPMQLNDGKFKENGGCGYVLKPEYMRSFAAEPSKPIILHVNIISGIQLPKPLDSNTGGLKMITKDILDPFVQVSVFGISRDTAEYRTKTVPNNGYNPVWDQVDVK